MHHCSDIRARAIDFRMQVDFHRRRVVAGASITIPIDGYDVGIGKPATHGAPAIDERTGALAQAGMAVEIDNAVGFQDPQRGQQILASRIGAHSRSVAAFAPS